MSERAIAPCPNCEKETAKDPYYLANATLGAAGSSSTAASVVSLPQLLLDPILRKGGRWRLNCTKCDLIVGLPKGLKKVEVSDEHECSACDAKCLIMTKIYGERDETEEFEKIACCFCEDDIRETSTVQFASSLSLSEVEVVVEEAEEAEEDRIEQQRNVALVTDVLVVVVEIIEIIVMIRAKIYVLLNKKI